MRERWTQPNWNKVGNGATESTAMGSGAERRLGVGADWGQNDVNTYRKEDFFWQWLCARNDAYTRY